jgi:hypothetical protein
MLVTYILGQGASLIFNYLWGSNILSNKNEITAILLTSKLSEYFRQQDEQNILTILVRFFDLKYVYKI